MPVLQPTDCLTPQGELVPEAVFPGQSPAVRDAKLTAWFELGRQAAAVVAEATRPRYTLVYVYQRAWQERVDVMVLLPASGSGPEGDSYGYTQQQIDDARAKAQAYADELAGLVTAEDVAAVPITRDSYSAPVTFSW